MEKFHRLSEYKVERYQDRVKGDIAERKMFYALEEYYKMAGDDVLVVHSHKFYVNNSNIRIFYKYELMLSYDDENLKCKVN